MSACTTVCPQKKDILPSIYYTPRVRLKILFCWTQWAHVSGHCTQPATRAAVTKSVRLLTIELSQRQSCNTDYKITTYSLSQHTGGPRFGLTSLFLISQGRAWLLF